MESAARAALNQFRALVARRGRAAWARHLSTTTTTTGSKGSWSSLDERPVAPGHVDIRQRPVADRAAAATAADEFRDPPAKTRLYIVHLVPTGTGIKRADDVDRSKAAELHHSILSSVVGSEEEATRCMVRSFVHLHAFSAMLTDSQARTISDLPEF